MLRKSIQSARVVYASVTRFVGNVLFDRPAGIETTKVVRLDELGLGARDRENYHATPWLTLRRLLAEQAVTDEDVFIDFGCGKGRVLYQAALYPFRRVIGVELSPELGEIARENIERSRGKLKCRDVEVVVQDVLDYAVPDDATLVYFFDPFHGAVFAAVAEKLAQSVRRCPREMTIIYFDPHEEAALLAVGARLVKTTGGFRPTKAWAQENSVRTYKLGVPLVRAGDCLP